MTNFYMTQATKQNNWYYNPKLSDRAKRLRRAGTKGEAMLWKHALKNRMLGYKFIRQRPVLNFIADFMCKELMLIIEVDGLSHMDEDSQLIDEKRDKALESIGFTLFRMNEDFIVKNISLAISMVESEIHRISELRTE